MQDLMLQGPVTIPAEGPRLEGCLDVPAGATGMVVFAHGSGSGRISPRNRRVAAALRAAGLGTLLLDLLTQEEARERAGVFGIPLLGARVVAAARWLRLLPDLRDLPLGCFGASTGAAAALYAAATLPGEIRALVSRGGRPDLAESWLARVRAPTLLIVGGDDPQVLEHNRRALDRMTCPRHLEVIPGATHLFEEQGALEEVIRMAEAWFLSHLSRKAGNPGETT
jgi:putative phosphoribosyl transferase